MSPNNQSILVNNNPTFDWNFTDTDSENQSAFQIIFDNDPEFGSIDLDTGVINSTNCSWQCSTGTNFTEVPDGNWYWRARTKDCDGDWGLYSDPWQLIIDSKTPYSNITYPINNSICNSVNSISGAVIDPINGTGVDRVEITIKRQYGNSYWNGESWVNKQTWLITTGYNNWTYDSSKIPWISGRYYYIQSRATDNATNVEIPVSKNIFLFDPDIPSITIEHPVHISWLNQLNTIYGIAFDGGGSQIDKVELSIQNLNDDKYWTGSTWGNSKTWVLASGNLTWSYDSKIIPWATNTRYQLEARVIDYANNIGIPENLVIFGIDLDVPSSNILYPSNVTYVNNLDSISGSAFESGGSGIKTVEISIQDNLTKYFWNNFTWVFEKTWLPCNGTELWSFSSPVPPWKTDNQYTIRTRVIDHAGNVETPGNGSTFLFDNQPPEISIIINSGDEYTNSTSIQLSLLAQDLGAGASLMRFSFDSTSWSDWEEFKKERQHTLLPKNEEKIIYFQAQDRAGNIAESVFDSIILDTIPPDISMLINDGAKYTNYEQVILKLNVMDDGSGAASMRFRTSLTWTPWESFKSVRSFSLPLGFGDGEIEIQYCVKDYANNWVESSESIILDKTPPHSLSISILNDSSDQEANSINLKLIAFDNTSGVDQMSFSLDGETWSSWEDYIVVKSHVIPLEKEGNKIYFKVKDRAGNVAEPVNTTIPTKVDPEKSKTKSTLDLWNILFIIIILIIIVAFAVFILKRKKKVKEEPAPELAVTIKPEILPGPELVTDEIRSEEKAEDGQLPITTPPTETTQAPELMEPSTSATVPGTIPEPQQIAQSETQPQLPPVQTLQVEQEQANEITPEPLDQSSEPSHQETAEPEQVIQPQALETSELEEIQQEQDISHLEEGHPKENKDKGGEWNDSK
jgi:hypothetical protein